MKRTAKAAKLVLLDNDDPILAETEAIQGRIRQRAFELSQRRPPDVHKLYDWIAAEAEVVSVPPVEVIERDGMFDVRFAVAGVNPDDVNVMVTPCRIVLKSQFTHQHDSDTGTVHLCDFKSITIFRAVTMPEPIDVTSVRADFEEGLLHISAVKEGTSTVKEGTSGVKEGTSAVKEGTSAVGEGTSGVKEGASGVKEDAGAVKEGAGEEVRKRPATARKTGVKKSRAKQP